MTSHVILYHYTRRSDKDQIVLSRQIRMAIQKGKKNHAHFGPGAYGTTLDPSFGKAAIARNNWTSHWKCKLDRGYVDYAIWVKIPEHKIIKCPAGDRKIVKHDGPVPLLGQRDVYWGVVEVLVP